jgi:alpha-glucosidase
MTIHFCDLQNQADFGEYLPLDAVLKDSQQSPLAAHNLYPLLWARLNREAIDEFCMEAKVQEKQAMCKREIVFFMRSASAQSIKYAPAFWAGDQLPTWDQKDGLKSVVTAALTSSLSGMALTHSDIGGFTGVNLDPHLRVYLGDQSFEFFSSFVDRNLRIIRNDRELFVRWMELSSVLSVSLFRTHEGSTPGENLQVWSDEGKKKKSCRALLGTALESH